ncbi:MAG: tRNA lysidine(34) synthetase TilS [Candidatus Atribacteria bacterium]|nr:tRNA lysidine(34) synthetase TilS [Candidatus Atribacteria bacterium]
MALTEIFLHFKEELLLEIALFHLNHGLRGGEAERDEKFCRDFAQARKLPIFVERRDVRALQREEKLSLEEAARKARYLALREGAQRWGASRVALGHTLDDQAETILMNLIRGTGLRGLSGMRMQSDIFIRPLLTSSKREILEFLQEKGVPFVEDSSNRDVSFFRNQIRLVLMPLLEELNPRFKEALLRLSLNLQEEMVLSEAGVDLPWEMEKEIARIPLDFLLFFSGEKRLSVLRDFLRRARGNLWDIGRVHLKAVDHLVEKKRGEMVLPGKFQVWVEEGWLYASPLYLPLAKTPRWEFSIALPGQNVLQEIGFSIEGDFGKEAKAKDGWCVTFDFDRSVPPFVVRNFREGDRIWKDGKAKKVKEIFAECGLAWEWRERVPFLCDQEKIIWIPGVVLDERVRVQENSKRILGVIVKKHKG